MDFFLSIDTKVCNKVHKLLDINLKEMNANIQHILKKDSLSYLFRVLSTFTASRLRCHTSHDRQINFKNKKFDALYGYKTWMM